MTELCHNCNTNICEEDGLLCTSCREKLGQFKVSMILDGSNQYSFGPVLDAHGYTLFIPPEVPVIGFWQIDNNGDTWVTLMSPVQAMHDSLTLKIVEFTKGKVKKDKNAPKAPKKVKEIKTTTPSAPVVDELAKLRALFPKKT